MPLGSLKTTTYLGDKVIEGDLLNVENYDNNQQNPDKKPEPQLKPHAEPKKIVVDKKPAPKKQIRTKADKAVMDANAADIRKKNLN